MSAVKAMVALYIDRAIRIVSQRLAGQGFHPNQAQLCMIPVSSEDTSRATRRRTS